MKNENLGKNYKKPIFKDPAWAETIKNIIKKMAPPRQTILTVLIYEELDHKQAAQVLEISELEVLMAHKNLLEEIDKNISPIPGLTISVRDYNLN